MLFIYIFIFVVGSVFGSFFNVCLHRIPQKKSIIFPGSHCPNCGIKINPLNNIPIFSYIFLKGKCRNCKTKIHPHYLLVEILTPLLFIILFYRFGNVFSLIYLKYLLLFSIGLMIIFIDIFHKIIPDVLSLPLILTGIIFSLFPQTDISLSSSLIGAGSGFFLFVLIAMIFKYITKRDSLGGGDIKLIAALGTFTGLYGIIFIIFISSVLSLVTLIIIKHDLKKEFPFGPFLIFGSFLYIILGDYLISVYLGWFGLRL